MKNFSTAQEFSEFCEGRHACASGLDEIRGLTLAEWWDKTQRGDWMEWLKCYDVWCFTPAQQAEYDRMVEPARAEYDREIRLVPRAAWAELCRVKANAIRQIIGNPFKG